MGLRARLTTAVGLTVALAQLAWGWQVILDDEALVRDEAARRGREVLRALAVACAVPLAERQMEVLDGMLDRYASDEGREVDLHSVGIIDMDGYSVAHTDPKRFARRDLNVFIVRAVKAEGPMTELVDREDGAYLQLSMPVVSGMRWGTAVAELSLEPLEKRIEQMRRKVVLVSLGQGALVAAVLYVLMSHLVLRRLEPLAWGARRISDGDLDARLQNVSGSDELSILGQVFNQMAARVQGQTRLLEEQVSARTKQLTQANLELEQAVTKLEQLARTDGLTGLLNHRAFHETLVYEVQRTYRYPAPLSLLMIDVDHFKKYNDAHGHPAGDVVLRTLAMLFTNMLRTTDQVARYGGEEFAIVLPDTDKAQAVQVALKLCALVRNHAIEGAAKSQPLGRVTISVGVATSPDDADTAPELVSAADEALYNSKALGRDQVDSAPPTEET